jgi:hypothetical protein
MAGAQFGGDEMGIRSLLFAGVVAALAFSNQTVLAQSETSLPGAPQASRDENLRKMMSEKKYAYVLLSVVMDPQPCGDLEVNLRSLDGRQGRVNVRHKAGTYKLFAPGTYQIISIWCRGFDRKQFRGPYAQFSVSGGEFLDVGVLKLKYQTKSENLGITAHGTMHKSVEGSTAETHTLIARAFPVGSRRMIRRNMTLVGPADVGIIQR